MAINTSGLNFNGTSRYVLLSTTDTIKNLTEFTRMAWIKNAGNTTSGSRRMFVERQGTGTRIRFAITPMKGLLRFEFSPKDGVTDTNYDYKYTWNDRWHHVAFSARGIGGSNPTYTIFLDGTAVAEGTLVVPSGTTVISNTTPLGGNIYLGNASYHTTGGNVFAADTYWNGLLDELYTFNGAKTETDILDYITSKDVWPTSDSEMVSAWRFDENTGTSTSSSKGSMTGTLSTSSLWTLDRPFIGNGAVDTTNPIAPTLPGTPTTELSSDGFRATWNSTTDNVAIQYYELQVSPLSDFSSYTAYNTGLDTTHKISGLLPSSNYYWRARAFDAAGNASGYTTAQSLTTSATGDLTAPNPPTNLVASSISHVSFRVDWTASSSSDETGYKIDVGLDKNFNTYLLGYRNKDIGNVTNHTVLGTDPLTLYYVRLRAYDAADNESDESASITVQTANLPDTNAPLEVELLSPTSVDARAFTANWEEGIDDTGVSYYLLDVATDEAMTQFVTIEGVTYNELNIGNVTSYRISGLAPETGYFYRVSAVDGAGNIGPHGDPIAIETLPSIVDEGGFISSTSTPTDDAWTDTGAPTTNNGLDTVIQVQGNGTVSTNYGFLRIDLSGVPGTIQNAVLNLYVRSGGTGTVSVQAAQTTFSETAVTYATQPTVAGTPLVVSNPVTGAWISVDLASLLTGPAVYVVKLSTISAQVFTFDSKEGTNPPTIDIESDPNTATTVDPAMTVETIASIVTNMIKNPSGEDGTTNFWTAIGSTPATLSNIGTDAYSGTKCFQAVCSGAVLNQGTEYSKTDIASGGVGKYWTASVAVKLVSGSGALRLRMNEYSSGGALLSFTPVTFTAVTGQWQRFSVTKIMSNASTAFVTFCIETVGATASTFLWDAAIMRGGSTTPTWRGGYFDGNTSGAAWNGTANASTSYRPSAVFNVDSTYTGDSDEDNSVVPSIRPQGGDWFFFPDMQTRTTYNRTTKRITTLVGPFYTVVNYIRNPSFSTTITPWTISNPNANATLTHETDFYYSGVGSARLDWGAGTGSGLLSSKSVAAAAEVWTARARVYIPEGVTVNLQIRSLTSGGGFNAFSPPVVGTSQLSGINDWVELTESYTMPVGTGLVDVFISIASTTGGTIYVDAVKLEKGTYNNPYIDGDMSYGMWDGDPNNSYTSFALQPLATYDFKHTYTDPDGIVNAIGDASFDIGTTFQTEAAPDNVTTTHELLLTASPTTIYFEASYHGDDNNDNSCKIEYKRTDLPTWVTVSPITNRNAKTYSGTIVDLHEGTSYTVRATFTDSDGIFNTNPMTQMSTTLTNLGSPTAESTIMFNGFVLMGRQDAKIGVNEHNAFGFPERRVQVEDLPRVDGAIELQNLWGRRTITMTGFVEGDTRGELDDNKNMLKQALAQKLGRLVIDTLSNKSRYYYATCQSLVIPEKGGENIRHLTWDAEFICADPFAYESESTLIPEFSVGNGGSTTAANLGDVQVEPYFKIRTTHRYSTTITIVNNTTGERITPQTTILSGDKLIIDCARKSVLKNGIEVDYIGTFPHLAVGSNQISYTITATSGSPTALFEISWRHRFI